MWAAERPLNVLFITVDDMNFDSPGFMGNGLPEVTPHLDRLASESLLLDRAHVTVPVCQPCRQSMMTGRYPHNIGAPGFDPIREDIPTLQEHLRAAGYYNAILSKTHHLAPEEKFCWDHLRTLDALGHGRDPQRYFEETRDVIRTAQQANKPFFLMANANDPHRPFAGTERTITKFGRSYPASRVYTPEEVDVPPFLPDLPEVRQEVAEYYTSVRRADDTVGAVLRALDESGAADKTLVMFLSDHGMSIPFGKNNLYPMGTRTPWLVRWPGVTKPGAVDREHLIGSVDFMPTILDALGLSAPEALDGRSFLPILRDGRQAQRDHLYTMFYATSAERLYPMRCMQNERYAYIYNAWSDGERQLKNESMSGRTFAAMQAAAKEDPALAARVHHFLHRTPEELYDKQADLNVRHNLIADAQYAGELTDLRLRMEEEMRRSTDPLLPAFRKQVEA